MLKYIIIGIIIVVVFLVVKLAKKMKNDYAKDREDILQRGGMRKVYSTFIDGILEYQSAKIEEEDGNEVLISGEFVGSEDGEKHGNWTLEIRHTFNILKVKYVTKVYSNDVIQGEKRWEFPVTSDQHEMLTKVKNQMDSTVSHVIRIK